MEHQEQAAHDPISLSTEGHSELSSLVDRWIAAFNAHDAGQIVSLYHDEAELFDSGMRYPRKGRDAIRAWFTQRFEQMPGIEYTRMKSFLQVDEGVVTWIARGTTPALLGQRWLVRPYEVEGVSQFVMRDSRIYWQHGFYDHLSIVEKVLPFLKWLPIRL